MVERVARDDPEFAELRRRADATLAEAKRLAALPGMARTPEAEPMQAYAFAFVALAGSDHGPGDILTLAQAAGAFVASIAQEHVAEAIAEMTEAAKLNASGSIKPN